MLHIVKNPYFISILWPKIRSDMDKYASDMSEIHQLLLRHLVIFDYSV